MSIPSSAANCAVSLTAAQLRSPPALSDVAAQETLLDVLNSPAGFVVVAVTVLVLGVVRSHTSAH